MVRMLQKSQGLWSDRFHRGHRFVCSHAKFTDIRVLLDLKEMWNDAAKQYVSMIFQNCRACRATAPLHPSPKVDTSSLYTVFNGAACVH